MATDGIKEDRSVDELVASSLRESGNFNFLKLIPGLIDLTSLEGTDREENIVLLCRKAMDTGAAAVCVYPEFISLAKECLSGSNLKVATVAGAFQHGQLPLDLRIREIETAAVAGADEIDVVIARGKMLSGKFSEVQNELNAIRKASEGCCLKIILETGELGSRELVRKASQLAIRAGADFIKTSTGKAKVNATLPEFCIMALEVKKHFLETGKSVGLKAAGGIAESHMAFPYLGLTTNLLGPEWLKPSLFRLGASRLMDEVMQQLKA